MPREFGPCWIQEPVTLTDAFGRVAPVHLELINSWEVLDSVLMARFRDGPGERKIREKQFTLEDRTSMMDIDRKASFETSFFPGRSIDMAIVFKQTHLPLGQSCPGCGLTTGLDALTAVNWYVYHG